MALLNWNRRRYTVGSPALDDQHAAFIGSLNKLHAAMTRGQGKLITGSLLQTLIAAAHQHLTTEELLMAEANYPALPQHRIEHRTLTSKLEELKALHEQGDRAVCIPLLNFMRDWLSNHILQTDSKYAPWLQSRGGK